MGNTFLFSAGRWAIWRLIPFVLGVAVLAASGCTRRVSTAPDEEAPFSNDPQQVSWDVRFLVNNDDQPRAEIVAGTMARYENEDSTYTVLRGAPADSNHSEPDLGALRADTLGSPPDSAAGRVKAHLFDESGDSSAVITADEMTYWDEERRFEAQGRVVVTTAEGKRLTGEHLAWDEAGRRVSTPGFVHITTPTDRMQGYGFEADEDLNNYRLRDVTGETTIEE